MANQWTYTQDFEGLTVNSDISGQDSWNNGATYWTVVNTDAAVGSQCIDDSVTRTNSMCYRTVTNITSGIAQVHVAMKCGGTKTNFLRMGSSGGSNNVIYFILNAANNGPNNPGTNTFYTLDKTTGWQSLGNFNSNQWYDIYIYVDLDAQKHKIKIGSGSYSALFNFSDIGTAVSSIGFDTNAAASGNKVDDIRPYSDATTSYLPRLQLLGVGQ